MQMTRLRVKFMHAEGHLVVKVLNANGSCTNNSRTHARRIHFNTSRFNSSSWISIYCVEEEFLTVWVQFHGQLVWQEYSAPDHRRLTAGAITEANEPRDGCEPPWIVELLLSTCYWLMRTLWSSALRARPGSCSMMDSPTRLTTRRPFGRHYSRLYLHPLHLRLEAERKKERKFTWEIWLSVSAHKINGSGHGRSSSIEIAEMVQ